VKRAVPRAFLASPVVEPTEFPEALVKGTSPASSFPGSFPAVKIAFAA